MKNLLYLLFILPLITFGQLTPCQIDVTIATGALGEFIPQCEDDGSYASIQCWESTGYCWCVDESGVEIPGTIIQSWVGTPDCSNTQEALCISASGVQILEAGFWENPIDPCDMGECTSDGQFIEIIIDCMEETGILCNGEWLDVEGECCSICVETEVSYCDSIGIYYPINLSSGSIDDDYLQVFLETSFVSNYHIPYAGLMLLNNLGDTIALENMAAANVYGIGPYTSEERYLYFVNDLILPFTGELCLVEGFFAGVPSIVCTYPITLQNIGLNEVPLGERKLLKMVDVLGKEHKEHKKGMLLFYIYEDGKSLKKYKL